MKYISVIQFAEKYGKTWNIPADATLPKRGKVKEKIMPLLKVLREQKASKLKGSIY